MICRKNEHTRVRTLRSPLFLFALFPGFFQEVRTVGRKNRRGEIEYRQRLGFNPDRYTAKKELSRNRNRSTYTHPSVKAKPAYRIPCRGEIWVARLGSHPNTSIQEGCRPVLIVSNDKGNHTSNTVVVLPLTSQIKRSELPSHVELNRDDLIHFGPEEPVAVSMALAEQVTTISKNDLGIRIARIRDTEKLREIDTALIKELGITK